MTRFKRHRRRDDRGAAAVEFALLSSFVLIPLLLGLIGFGWVFFNQITITQAAREGARALSLCNTNTSSTCLSDAENKAISGAAGMSLTTSNFPSGSQVTCAGNNVNNNSTMTINYTVNALLFNLTITGKASMPCGG